MTLPARPVLVLLLAAAVATALVATAAPLIVYAATLALLGWAHVVVELRYVRDRFGARIVPRLAASWLALLFLLALARAADFAGFALPGGRTLVELGLLVALLLVTALAARGASRIAAAGATAIVAALLLAIDPVAALAVLAFLHNLTPLGFLAERFEGAERRRVLAIALAAFVAVPALMIGGAFDALATLPDRLHLDGAFLGIGVAADHFGLFLPGALQDHAWTPRLFAAAVYLQCAHYFVVIHVLPKLLPAPPTAQPRAQSSARPSARLVAPRIGIAAAVLIGAALAFFFLHSFRDARALYGIAAAVHAFVEWPLFLALLIGVAT